MLHFGNALNTKMCITRRALHSSAEPASPTRHKFHYSIKIRAPATTIHALFELDGELHSKMDFAKLDDPKVAFLLQLQVLLLDEAWGQKQHRLPKSICIYATLYALTSAMLPSWFR